MVTKDDGLPKGKSQAVIERPTYPHGDFLEVLGRKNGGNKGGNNKRGKPEALKGRQGRTRDL